MSIDVTPHLNFRGQARAALEHYQAAFGGEVMVATAGDMGAPEGAPERDRVVFGQVVSPDGFRIMAYDVPADQPWDQGADPFFVSVRGADTDEVARYWEAMAPGSTVVVPLGPAAWATSYGMLKDPFGITWVFDVLAPYGG